VVVVVVVVVVGTHGALLHGVRVSENYTNSIAGGGGGTRESSTRRPAPNDGRTHAIWAKFHGQQQQQPPCVARQI